MPDDRASSSFVRTSRKYYNRPQHPVRPATPAPPFVAPPAPLFVAPPAPPFVAPRQGPLAQDKAESTASASAPGSLLLSASGMDYVRRGRCFVSAFDGDGLRCCASASSRTQLRELRGTLSGVCPPTISTLNGDGDDNGSFNTSFACGEGARWTFEKCDLSGRFSWGVPPAGPAWGARTGLGRI